MDPRGNQHQLFCFAVSLDGLVIIPHLSGKCNPFFEIFSKKFLKGESGGENLLLPSGLSAGFPANLAIQTPRTNRRVRVLPAAGEKTPAYVPGPDAGLPASLAIQTPRPNRRVRVLPAAGEKNSRPIGRLLSVLAKTYFSGPSPAKYLRRRRA